MIIDDYYQNKLYSIGLSIFERYSNGGKNAISKTVLESLSNEELNGVIYYCASRSTEIQTKHNADHNTAYNCIDILSEREKDFNYDDFNKWLLECDHKC